MSVIVLRGSADSWAEAALEHRSAVLAYARRTLRNLDTSAYWCDKILDGYFDTARRKWEKGKDLRLSLKLLVNHGKRGAIREQRTANRNLSREVKDLRERADTVIDVRLALARMDEKSRQILTLLAEGHSWAEVEERTGWSAWTISKVREELGRWLADYRPDTLPAKRGRGRPKRDR